MPTKKVLEQMLDEDMGEYLLKIRGEIAGIINNSDEATREKLAEVYAAARILSMNVDQWQRFCNRPEWMGVKGRPRIVDAHRNEAIHYAVRWAVGLETTAASTIYRYRKVLKQFWIDGVAAEDIPAAIVEGGGIESIVSGKNTVLSAVDAGSVPVQFLDGTLTRKLGAITRGFTALMVLKFEAPENGVRKVSIEYATSNNPTFSSFQHAKAAWKH